MTAQLRELAKYRQPFWMYILSPKRLLFIAIASLVFTVFAFERMHVEFAAAAPGINPTINFQGKVVNSNGLNVADGQYTFVFKLYGVSSGGSAVWTETQSNVQVTAGIFRVSLGSVQSLSGIDFNDDSLYLGIEFNSDGEMSPRIRFATVPYAFNAQKVAGLTVTDTTGTFTLAPGKTFVVNNGLTFSGTDSTVFTFPSTSGNVVTEDFAQILTNKTIGSTGLTFSGATTDITTGTNEDFTITPNGSGNIILSTDFNSGVRIGSSANSSAVLSVSGGIGNNAALIVNNANSGDILTASSAGVTKFVITDSGAVNSQAYTSNGGILYTSTTGLISQTAGGSNGQCLTFAGGSPAWGSCGGGGGGNGSNWYLNTSNGTISPINNTVDFLLGAAATGSARFAVLNINSGVPTASLSAGVSGAAYFSANGTLATTAMQSLNIGNATTGQVNVTSGSYQGINLLTGNGTTLNTGTLALATGTTTSGTSGLISIFSGNAAGSSGSITQVGTTKTGSNNLGATTQSVTFDSIPQDGDIIFLTMGSDDSPAPTPPAGFSEVFKEESVSGIADSVFGWYKRASGEVSATYTVTFAGTNYRESLIGSVFRGAANTGNPFEVVSVGSSGFSATPVAPSITTLTDNAWHIAYFWINEQNLTATSAPAGYTKLGGVGVAGQLTSYKAISPAGSTGTTTITGPGAQFNIGVSLSLKPGTTGGSSGSIAIGSGTSTGNLGSGVLNLSTGGTDSGASGNITLMTGSASGGGTSGNILIDAGSASGGTLGSILIGNTNAQNITLGRTGQGITLPGFDCSGYTNGGKLTTTSGGVLACANDISGGGGGSSSWNLSIANGTISPINNTVDFLLGSTATASAKFGVIGMNGSGAATATVSGNIIVMPRNGSGGKVGIGTDAPTANLDVRGTNTAGNTASFVNNSIDTANLVSLSSSGQITSGKLLAVDHSSTYTSQLNNTGNLLSLARSITANISGSSPTLDATSNSSGSPTTSVSWSHVVGNGTNRYLIVGVDLGSPSVTVTSATYDGVAMTYLGDQAGASSRVYLYGLVNPNSGTHNIVVNYSGSAFSKVGAASWTNVDSTTPTGTFTSSTGTGTSTTINVPSGTSDVIFDTYAVANPLSPLPTAGGGQTSIWANGTSITGGGSYKSGSASTTSMSWSHASSLSWSHAGVAIKPASAPSVALTGALANLTSNCTITSGGCSDTSNILSLTQSYAAATGSVLGISNSGLGAGINITSNSGGQSALIINKTGANDIFSASASGATVFTVSNAGAIRLGTSEGTNGQCLKSGGVGSAAVWGSCGGGGGGSQTPWESDIDGDGYSLLDLGTNITARNGLTIGTASNGVLTLAANGTGDVIVSGDGDTNLQVNFSAAPTVDMTVISNSGQGTQTTGVDGLQITFAQNGAGAIDNAGLRIDVTSNNSNASSTLYGINIGDITGDTPTESALRIGTGWDRGLVIESGGATNSGLVYSGAGRPTKTITLSPEYSGAVLTTYYGGGTDSNITGAMTATNDSTPGTSIRNYYQWLRTTDATQHFYTVAVRVKLPADFSAWATSNAVTVSYITQSGTNTVSDLDVRLYNESSATIVTSSTDNASTSWTTVVFDDTDLDNGGASDWDAAGQTAVIYLRMGSASSNYVRIGDITLNYLASF